MKRRRLPVLASATAIAACLASCSGGEVSLVPADYRSWSRATERPLDYPVPGHLDNYRVVYANDAARRWSTETRDGRTIVTYPAGAVFVKEVYAGSGRPAEGASPQMLTVMVKAPGDRRAVRGWLFVTRNPATGEEGVVKQQLCAECHAAANDRHTYGEGNPAGELRDGVFIRPPRL